MVRKKCKKAEILEIEQHVIDDSFVMMPMSKETISYSGCEGGPNNVMVEAFESYIQIQLN